MYELLKGHQRGFRGHGMSYGEPPAHKYLRWLWYIFAALVVAFCVVSGGIVLRDLIGD